MKEPPSLRELTRGERRFLISLGVTIAVVAVGFIIIVIYEFVFVAKFDLSR